MKKLTYLTLSLFSIGIFAQEVSKERIKTVISTLASDEMKGREIWTPENENAANYIATLFKENKLEYCTGNSYLIPFEYKGQKAYNVCGVKKGKRINILDFPAISTTLGPVIKPVTIFITGLMMMPAELQRL